MSLNEMRMLKATNEEMLRACKRHLG